MVVVLVLSPALALALLQYKAIQDYMSESNDHILRNTILFALRAEAHT